MEYRALLRSLEDKVTCVEMGERSSVGLYREISPRRVVSEDDIGAVDLFFKCDNRIAFGDPVADPAAHRGGSEDNLGAIDSTIGCLGIEVKFPQRIQLPVEELETERVQ